MTFKINARKEISLKLELGIKQGHYIDSLVVKSSRQSIQPSPDFLGTRHTCRQMPIHIKWVKWKKKKEDTYVSGCLSSYQLYWDTVVYAAQFKICPPITNQVYKWMAYVCTDINKHQYSQFWNILITPQRNYT